MQSIYILKLEKNKYYVGTSFDVRTRYNQHKDGSGSSWTSKYRPIRILEVKKLTGIHRENNETEDLMKKYGIDNVRGGDYCQIKLPDHIRMTLEHKINGKSGCYNCGETDHYAKDCDYESEDGGCFRCGRDSHWVADCYAKYDIDGYLIKRS